jgi:histidinol-phosphatase (PHP family)
MEGDHIHDYIICLVGEGVFKGGVVFSIPSDDVVGSFGEAAFRASTIVACDLMTVSDKLAGDSGGDKSRTPDKEDVHFVFPLENGFNVGLRRKEREFLSVRGMRIGKIVGGGYTVVRKRSSSGEMTEYKIPIPFDYHSHHQRCGHATGEMREYVERAIALGLTDFGVSDHGPAYWLAGDHAQPGTQMAVSWLPGYVEEAQHLKRSFTKEIRLWVGVEADFIEGSEKELAALLDAQAFDYVLGSVHYALGKTVFRKDWDTLANTYPIFADYYRQVILAAESGIFDILSHLTAVEAYSPPIEESIADELYPPVADAVAKSGCVVEINTSGYRKIRAGDGSPGNIPFPNPKMLRLLVERDVPLTYSSDCHDPDEVGYGASKVFSLLEELGLNANKPEQYTPPRAVQRGLDTMIWVFR